MDELLEIIGTLFSVIFLFVFVIWCYEIEFIMPHTLESGIVKIDDKVSYNCKPTEKTLKYLEIEKQIKELEKLK